jgi:uncharacterized membrane protein YccC
VVAVQRAAGAFLRHLAEKLQNISTLLDFDAAELPASTPSSMDLSNTDRRERAGALESQGTTSFGGRAENSNGPMPMSRPRLNRFLLRYTVRHTIGMSLAFLCGLVSNSPAMHAALWLLMIGGAPSHGATARKFAIRAVGAAGALALAALGTMIIAPNGTTVFSYMAAVFVGALFMAYIGQGGGLLSYLSIGGTAFVIAFSGPGPRNDAFASIWTIWGISFGMLIRAVVSMVWRERARRTLVEEFQRPLEALLLLVSAAHRGGRDVMEIEDAQMALIGGVREMLSVASDAQLEGQGAGIDAANLVDALDTLRRLGFLLANLAMQGDTSEIGKAQSQPELESCLAELDLRFADWLESLRVQEADGVPDLAPLREMVLNCDAPELDRWQDSPGPAKRLAALTRTLEEQLKKVSVY